MKVSHSTTTVKTANLQFHLNKEEMNAALIGAIEMDLSTYAVTLQISQNDGAIIYATKQTREET